MKSSIHVDHQFWSSFWRWGLWSFSAVFRSRFWNNAYQLNVLAQFEEVVPTAVSMGLFSFDPDHHCGSEVAGIWFLSTVWWTFKDFFCWFHTRNGPSLSWPQSSHFNRLIDTSSVFLSTVVVLPKLHDVFYVSSNWCRRFQKKKHMGVSWNRGTPVIIHFNFRIFHCKPSIHWGYPSFVTPKCW